jgi:hypothetical protein
MLDRCSWHRPAHSCLSRQRCRELWLIAVSWSLNCCYEVAVWLLTFYQLISDHDKIKKNYFLSGTPNDLASQIPQTSRAEDTAL